MTTLSLVLATASVLSAIVYWVAFAANDTESWVKSGTKTLPVLALAGASLCMVATSASGFWLFPLGLALGSLGDFLLSRPGERMFLAGMAAFAVGHLSYAVGFFGAGFELAGWGVYSAIALIGLALSTEKWLAPRTGTLRWPVRGYVLVIAIMGIFALGMAPHPSRGLILAGVALFIVSDVLLSLRLFVWTTGAGARFLSLALWPAYWGGQALIAYGTALIWGLKG